MYGEGEGLGTSTATLQYKRQLEGLNHTQRSQRAGYMLPGKKETARVESPHVLSMERA